MPGFLVNRFIDLTEKDCKYFKCGICFNIFIDPVETQCGHSFCKRCLIECIQNDLCQCPNCNQPFKRKRSIAFMNDPKTIFIYKYVFQHNSIANTFISRLKVKCDFESNGCREVMEIKSLSDHIIFCRFKYRMCEICGIYFEINYGHNCFEPMTSDQDSWKTMFEKPSGLFENPKPIQVKMANIYIDNFGMLWNKHLQNNPSDREQILFRNHLIPNLAVDMNSRGIFLEQQSITNFQINYESMQELVYCSDPTLNLIVIKPQMRIFIDIVHRFNLCNNELGTVNGCFDFGTQGFIAAKLRFVQ